MFATPKASQIVQNGSAVLDKTLMHFSAGRSLRLCELEEAQRLGVR
jgi:hypothetical protein